jgi:hypothetical protein
MPVVLTDVTNQVWCAEDPETEQMLLGWTGRRGHKALDILEFVQKRQKQFDNFVQKKRELEGKGIPNAGRL